MGRGEDDAAGVQAGLITSRRLNTSLEKQGARVMNPRPEFLR